MERREVRAMFKAIGYKVSFVRNPFNDALCNLAFKNDEMLKPVTVSASSCYSKEAFDLHKQAFDLVSSLKGTWLDDTEQKII